jgi:DNA mismatch repair protein MSH6
LSFFQELLAKMMHAEDERKVVLKDLSRRMFEKFSNSYNMWKNCVDFVAILDVLTSLAEYARNQNTTCTPEMVENDGQGVSDSFLAK